MFVTLVDTLSLLHRHIPLFYFDRQQIKNYNVKDLFIFKLGFLEDFTVFKLIIF